MNEKLEVVIFAAFIGIVGILMQGCAGIELGGKLGVYRVEEYKHTDTSTGKSTPMKCWFVNCNTNTEASGS